MLLATLIGKLGVSPVLAIPLVLVLGAGFGALMGWLIDTLKIPAFIITLAGMFFLRGPVFSSPSSPCPSITPTFTYLSSLSWKIPGAVA